MISKTFQFAASAVMTIVLAPSGCGGKVSVGSLQPDGSSSSGGGVGSSTPGMNGPGEGSGTDGSVGWSIGICPDIPTLFASDTCSSAGTGCHGANATAIAYGLDLASPNVASRLVGVKSGAPPAAMVPPGTLLINPANPSESAIYTQVTANPTYGLQMPFIPPYLDVPTQMCILQWVMSVVSTGGGSGSGLDAGTNGGAGAGQLQPPPLGLAGFAFVVNDAVRSPMVCASENWEFAPFPTSADSACNPDPMRPGCPGVNSVYLVNTGKVAVAYYATNIWNGHYVPGVATGAPLELAGVMNPGVSVNITSVFSGGFTALLGSSQPFSSSNSGKYAFDEGTIPWPKGVPGSGGSATMYVAQIEVAAACRKSSQQW